MPKSSHRMTLLKAILLGSAALALMSAATPDGPFTMSGPPAVQGRVLAL